MGHGCLPSAVCVASALRAGVRGGVVGHWSACTFVDVAGENVTGLLAGFDDHAGAVFALLRGDAELCHDCPPALVAVLVSVTECAGLADALSSVVVCWCWVSTRAQIAWISSGVKRPRFFR